MGSIFPEICKFISELKWLFLELYGLLLRLLKIKFGGLAIGFIRRACQPICLILN